MCVECVSRKEASTCNIGYTGRLAPPNCPAGSILTSYTGTSSNYLPQGGYVFVGLCLSVCLCVSKITQKVMDGTF